MIGGGLVAVKTTTAVPPPWGFRDMLKTFTPTVAQSLAGSSLIIIESWPVCVCDGVLLGEFEFPPQPEITTTSASTNSASTRETLEFMDSIAFSFGDCGVAGSLCSCIL